ncbi:MAG: sensor histidine kinase N-terminal domain-containing protein [Pirellulaceae bacterium]|nr:sensor histidine kinase N-terminal domain-containing protein [Pirellulaceae bacterium]
MLKSLRSRLLAGMLGSISVLLILFGVVIYTTISRSLLDEFDFSLEKMARTLAAAALVERGVIEVELAPELIPDFQEARGGLYFQYWVDEGPVLDRSASLAGADLPHFHSHDEAPVLQSIRLPNGQPARAAGMRFRPAIEYARERPDGAIQTDEFPPVTVVVARETAALEDRLDHLMWLLIAAGTGTMVVGLLVSVIVIARGLGPLRRLARDIAAIHEDELMNRVGSSGLPDEILPVVQRLNELLQRVEAAFTRERCFTSDVAHELRTPLAGIRSTLEVALSSDRSASEYKESLVDTLDISKRLQSMVENLLMLARLDAGQTAFHRERVGLSELVDDCWQPLTQAAAARGLVFENRIPTDLDCTSDRQSLTAILTNLLENCAEYTDANGRLWATGTADGDGVEIGIGNTGCQLTTEQVSHVFDRFWRADSARQNTGLHCGLGLAIVRRICSALGSTAVANVDCEGAFSVVVKLKDDRDRRAS